MDKNKMLFFATKDNSQDTRRLLSSCSVKEGLHLFSVAASQDHDRPYGIAFWIVQDAGELTQKLNRLGQSAYGSLAEAAAAWDIPLYTVDFHAKLIGTDTHTSLSGYAKSFMWNRGDGWFAVNEFDKYVKDARDATQKAADLTSAFMQMISGFGTGGLFLSKNNYPANVPIMDGSSVVQYSDVHVSQMNIARTVVSIDSQSCPLRPGAFITIIGKIDKDNGRTFGEVFLLENDGIPALQAHVMRTFPNAEKNKPSAFDGPTWSKTGHDFIMNYYARLDSHQIDTESLIQLYSPQGCFRSHEGIEAYGRDAIKDQFTALYSRRIHRSRMSMDCEAFPDGIMILVLGQLRTDEDRPQSYVETFILRATSGNFFITNNVFRLVLHHM